MAYIGQSLTEGTRRAYNFVATSGQTTFNAVYGVGAVDVYQNGILLQPSDYNSSSGSSVVLGVGAAVNDEITIIAHNTFSVADTVSSSQGGTFAGAVTASNGLTVDDDGATPLTVDRATNDGTIIDVQKDGTSVGVIGTNGGRLSIGSGDVNLNFNASANSMYPISDTSGTLSDGVIDIGASSARYKDLYLSGGVYLGGTGAANKLSDVEEGNWSPSLNVGTATAYQNQWYVKIGQLVTCYFYLYSLSNNSSGTQIQISGLPFTHETSHETYFSVHAGGVPNLPASALNLNGRVGQAGGNTVGLEITYPSAQSTIMSYSHVGSNVHLAATFSYITAA